MRDDLPRRFSLTLFLATMFAGVASAQEADTVHLPPIIVTATRVPIRADAVSATVTIISGDRLRAEGIATVADALRPVPGVAVVATGSFGGQTSLFLRGGESDYAKVLVDGVPQNQPGGSFDFANLGTEDVDRIEIVRGPVSVLYGSDAVAGVIQVFTRSGRGRAHGRLAFGGGTYGTEWGTGDLTGRAGALAYGVSLSRRTTDGIYAVNNGYRRDLVSAHLRLAPDSRTDAGLVVRYAGGVFHFPTDFAGRDSSDFDQHTTARGPSVGLDAGRWLMPRLETRVSLAYHREENRYDDGADSLGDTTAFCCFQSEDVVRRLVAGARANVHLSGTRVVTVGLELEQQRQTGTTLDTARRTAAVYAQVLAQLGQTVSLTVGARLDDNQQFGRHATGRAGAAWQLDERTRVRASAGTGFKEPSFFENFASGFVRGNPSLQPEQSTSWELGLEHARGPVNLSATYYDQRFRDFIEYSPVPLGLDSVNYSNVGAATARGTELSLTASLVHGLSLEAGYTYVRARDGATGERLLRRPSHTGSLRLGFAPARWGSVTLSATFTGDRDDVDFSTGSRVTLPPHTRVDASGEYRVTGNRGPLPALILTARIENLLDTRYQEVKNFRAPQRTILVGGELGFGR